VSQAHRICQQMEQTFNGEAWHGPSVLEILNGVNASIAVDKPIPGGHSVWEIVLHLIGTQGLLLNRLQGIAKELAPDQDWPPVPEPTETAWCETVERLEQQDKALREAVARSWRRRSCQAAARRTTIFMATCNTISTTLRRSA
jgi:hypothetical protein